MNRLRWTGEAAEYTSHPGQQPGEGFRAVAFPAERRDQQWGDYFLLAWLCFMLREMSAPELILTGCSPARPDRFAREGEAR